MTIFMNGLTLIFVYQTIRLVKKQHEGSLVLRICMPRLVLILGLVHVVGIMLEENLNEYIENLKLTSGLTNYVFLHIN